MDGGAIGGRDRSWEWTRRAVSAAAKIHGGSNGRRSCEWSVVGETVDNRGGTGRMVTGSGAGWSRRQSGTCVETV